MLHYHVLRIILICIRVLNLYFYIDMDYFSCKLICYLMSCLPDMTNSTSVWSMEYEYMKIRKDKVPCILTVGIKWLCHHLYTVPVCILETVHLLFKDRYWEVPAPLLDDRNIAYFVLNVSIPSFLIYSEITELQKPF